MPTRSRSAANVPAEQAEDATMQDAPPSHQPTVEEDDAEQADEAAEEEDYEEEEHEEPQRVKLVSTLVSFLSFYNFSG